MTININFPFIFECFLNYLITLLFITFELSENFRFDRFSLSRRYFPIQPCGAVRHDERGSKGARLNEREERGASPRSRPSPALLRCRASESEVSGALRDGAKDLTRRNFFSTPFQTLSDQKFRGATGRTNLKIFPAGVSTAA